MEQNINEIVKKAKAGDDRAVSDLYQIFYTKGINIANYYLHNRSDAEDMYQDSFIKAMQNLDRFDETKKFEPWFNTIIANTCKNHLDKMRPDNFGDISSEELDFVDTIENQDIDVMPEASYDRKELTQIMDEIMQNLPEAQRQAMVLYYYNQMPVSDIAKVQNIPVDSVKSRLNYGRKKVAEGVEKYEKKTGTKLFLMTSVLLTTYFKMDMVTKAQTIADTAEAGINVAETAIEVVDKADNTKTAAKTAGKILSRHLARRTILKASSAVIAIGAIGGGTAYVYETQINVKTSDEALFEWNGTEIISYTGVETDIVIPSKATSIGEQAFYNNTNIHSVDFSESKVRNISKMAFCGCNSLSQIDLPDSLETIGFEAFKSCESMNSITIPSNVHKIDGAAFADCVGLSSVTINSTSITRCDTHIFMNCSLTNVEFSDGMTYIPAYLFYNANFVGDVSIEIPENVVSIEDKAFFSDYGKSPVEFVFKGDKLDEIGFQSFYKCEMNSITLTQGVEKVGFNAFGGCEKLKEVVIEASDIGFDNAVFKGCENATFTVVSSSEVEGYLIQEGFENKITYID